MGETLRSRREDARAGLGGRPTVGYGDAMTALEALGWFVALPLLVYAVVAVAVYARSWIRSPRYRPGLSWWAEPVWLGGGDLAAAAQAEPVVEGGGCRASW
jgi:hypothetical protein